MWCARDCIGSRNISHKLTAFSGTPQETRDSSLTAGHPTLPAFGLGSGYKRGHKMECLFSLKWKLSSFLSRGVLKISFLLLASSNCFIWHSDEKC